MQIGQPDPHYKYPGGPRLFATATRCRCHDGEVAHSEDPEDFIAPAAHRVRAGTLLLANTDLLEPTFRRSVIYVVEHNDGGTLGVVLNRPSELDVDEVLSRWADRAEEPPVMFIGGPVQPNAVICLARSDLAIDGLLSPTAVDGISLVDLDGDPLDGGPDLTIRCFAGYAGWDAGQLEGELDEDAWFVVVTELGDAFTTDPDHLWRDVLARQPDELARYALYPADPSLN